MSSCAHFDSEEVLFLQTSTAPVQSEWAMLLLSGVTPTLAAVVWLLLTARGQVSTVYSLAAARAFCPLLPLAHLQG